MVPRKGLADLGMGKIRVDIHQFEQNQIVNLHWLRGGVEIRLEESIVTTVMTDGCSDKGDVRGRERRLLTPRFV
nr:hypothetical protein CFP56_00701 [Quercus suber]